MNLLKREPILLKLALKVCLLKLLQIYTLNILKFHLQNDHLGISELGAKVVVFESFSSGPCLPFEIHCCEIISTIVEFMDP